jgi:hypothetical protein
MVEAKELESSASLRFDGPERREPAAPGNTNGRP